MAGQTAAISAAIDRTINQFIIVMATVLVEELVINTPKDTTWAASNWLPTIGSPSTAPVGSKGAVSFAAQQIGLGVLRNYDYKSGLPIFITNTVPYIGILNMGSSQKAPAMFVEQAIVTAITRAAKGG